MPGIVNILAVQNDDASQLIWVIAVLLLSVVGTIFGKLNEAAKKKTPPPRAPRREEPDAAAENDRGASPPRS
ncbi:MAG: hypothetical protein ACPMAQ_03485, partial [Phycisphaerae bacterium]